MNFKKISNKNITLKDFTVKINELSNVEVFNSTDNQQWLWLYYKLLVDFLFKNKEVVSEQELFEFIELDIANIANTYKEYLTENRMHLLVKLQNYNQINSFDEIVLKNLFITKLKENITTIDKSWIKVSLFNMVATTMIISLILLTAFYAWDNIGWISLLSLSSLVLFIITKKITKKIYIKKQEENIKDKIEDIKKLPIQDNALMHQMNLAVELMRNEKLKEELLVLKNKTIHLIKIANQQNSFDKVEKDILKMWEYSIPKIIKNQNIATEDQSIKTIKAMELFIQSLLENFFLNNEMEINAQQKFWLAKTTSI